MKKFILSCSVVLLGLGLTGCGNQSHKSDTHSKAKSEKVSSKRSSSSSKSSSNSMSSSSSSSTSSITQSTPATSVNNQQQSQNTNVQQQSVAQQDTQPQTLTEFVNKYGMSPAAYKMQHDGMSELEALESTPDNMKTSGEIQLQHQLEQGSQQ